MQGREFIQSTLRLTLALAVSSLVLVLPTAPAHAASDGETEIVVGAHAPSNERFAAKELQRYLAQLTGARLPIAKDSDVTDTAPESMIAVGQQSTNTAIARLVADGRLPSQPPPAEGYRIKTVADRGHTSIAVVGGDATGSLYGAYTLLERYGARFRLDRDVLPEERQPFAIKQLDIAEQPAEKVRGLLPWNDFLNGPSGYSYEDYKHYLDQMLKLKMNTLVVHNYSGAYPGANINEPFMNFQCRGTGHDGYLDTSVSNQRWGLAPTRADDMAFGTGDLLPYDVLGSDAARATDEQPDAQRYIFLKAKAMMQEVVRYAQSRGMQVVLGTDLDELPQAIDATGCKWNDQDVLKARMDDILATYPRLKYIQLYIGESSGAGTQDVIDALRFVHDYVKSKRPDARLITGGWFQEQRMPEMDRALPKDIIFSMLLPHDMTVRPEWQQLQPGRERWPIPWMEFDAGLSEPQFAVGRMQQSLPALRAMGVEGMIGILWRTRAADTNVEYFAQDAWRSTGDALDKDAFYHDYAAGEFGAALADDGARALEAIEATGYPKGSTPEFFGPTRPPGWSMCGCASAQDTAATYASIEQQLAAMEARAPDATTRANVEYYRQFMRWMQDFWTAQYRVPRAQSEGLPQGDIRVNAGGGASEDLHADTGSDGPSSTFTTSGTVTNDFGYQDAMRSERWADNQPLVYRFPAPNGTYHVELYFQEGYFGVDVPGDPVGKRVFDVELEGDVVRKDFDIAKAAGGSLRGVRLSYDVPVTDGRLDIRFVNEVSNPKVDIIKAIRVDDQGNPAPLPGDPAKAWEALKDSSFKQSVEAYADMAGSLPSLGGLVSAAGGRWYPAYLPYEREIAGMQAVPPPDRVVGKGTPGGARITWRPYGGDSGRTTGYNVYRAPGAGGAFTKLNDRPLIRTEYEDVADGDFRYAVTAVDADGDESPRSYDERVAAGGADHAPPRVVLSPEEREAVAGEPLAVAATVVDGRDAGSLHATLHYRSVTGGPWHGVAMRPNVVGRRTTFYGDIPAQTGGELEYYVSADDGANVGFGPVAGRRQPSTATVVPAAGERPAGVSGLAVTPEADCPAALLRWASSGADVQQYEIFRGESADFPVDRAHYLTYVPSQQLVFRDVNVGPGKTYYYRVQARTITGRSGPASAAVSATAAP